MAVEKRNIFLNNTVEQLPYVSSPSRGTPLKIPERDINKHADFLRQKFIQAYAQNLTQKQVAAIRYKEGVYLEVKGKKSHDLIIKSLENRTTGIRLLNSQVDEDNITRATIYIPLGKENYFLKRIQAYVDSFEDKGKARYSDLMNSIEDVKLAILDSFWIGKKDDIPKEQAVWCEIWLRADSNEYAEAKEAFNKSCEEIGIATDDKYINFPERIVKLAFVNAEQLKKLINSNAYIAEIRRAPLATSFFDNLSPKEQKEWVDELLSRLEFNFKDVSVCILDTGITSAHPLLEPAIPNEGINAVDTTWGTNDHKGHGTEMAGPALYFDIKDKLISQDKFTIEHYIESVKILPPNGENDNKLYGAITQQAVSLAEISNPELKRAICMAITAYEYNTEDGSPTSWSAAIDSISSGAQNDEDKRLIFISAGNVQIHELQDIGYPDANVNHIVENPGQAWNAITVGAYCKDVQIEEELLKGYKAVADKGDLSPYSSSSLSWKHTWPIKPEILCDGGNIATDGTNYTECSDLSLLTTYYRPTIRMFYYYQCYQFSNSSSCLYGSTNND